MMKHAQAMQTRWLRAGLLLAPVLVVTCGCSTPPLTTDAADHYAGQTVRIIVPFGPGGGFDRQARVMAQHLGTHLPGQPTVIVENMPGAGGFVAARYMAHQARPDGLTFGIFSSGLVLQQLDRDTETDSFAVDVSRFVAVGSPEPDVAVCVFPANSRFRHLQTWRESATPPKMGMTGAASGSDATVLILSAALGLPVRAVRGYAGTAEIRQAIDAREVDGTCLNQSSFETLFVPNQDYVVAIQGGTEVSAGLEDVPLALDFTDTPDDQALLGALALMRRIGRYYALPPETPDELVNQMRRAFLQTMSDPVFRQNAARAGLEIDPMSGEDVSAAITSLLQLNESTRTRLARIVDAPPMTKPTEDG